MVACAPCALQSGGHCGDHGIFAWLIHAGLHDWWIRRLLGQAALCVTAITAATVTLDVIGLVRYLA